MKVAIHPGYGCFRLPEKFCALYGIDDAYNDTLETRMNAKLVNFIENSDNCSLAVAEIPDDNTDFTIIEYDGSEYVIYVLDGRIHYTYGY